MHIESKWSQVKILIQFITRYDYFCAMISVQQFVFNEFSENTYVIFDESKECIIIDPGCHHAEEKSILTEFISSNQLKPVKLVNTHCHIDHVLGNNFVANRYQLDLYLHKDELQTYADTGRWAEMFGMVMDEIPEKKVFINEGDQIKFGNSTLDIFLTPGHSIASLTFYNKMEKICIAGDVLFKGSIGRTDLPGGNFDTLISSIQTKLFNLDDDVKVYSGHGDPTSIGFERKHNPFLNN
ncbi:MAG: MBL fold metallo-hydrolase [Bacteroidota bacterium]